MYELRLVPDFQPGPWPLGHDLENAVRAEKMGSVEAELACSMRWTTLSATSLPDASKDVSSVRTALIGERYKIGEITRAAVLVQADMQASMT